MNCEVKLTNNNYNKKSFIVLARNCLLLWLLRVFFIQSLPNGTINITPHIDILRPKGLGFTSQD